MLFLYCQNGFQQALRRRILSAHIIHHFAVAIDGDTFRHQVFFNHVGQCRAFHIFCMAAISQRIRAEIRCTAQLNDTFRNLISMTLLFIRMHQEFIAMLLEARPLAMK